MSINGTTGEVIKGQQPVKKPGLTGDLATFMKWVDAKRRLRVLTNAGELNSAQLGFTRGPLCPGPWVVHSDVLRSFAGSAAALIDAALPGPISVRLPSGSVYSVAMLPMADHGGRVLCAVLRPDIRRAICQCLI